MNMEKRGNSSRTKKKEKGKETRPLGSLNIKPSRIKTRKQRRSALHYMSDGLHVWQCVMAILENAACIKQHGLALIAKSNFHLHHD
jgi:hypothetical protein